MLPTGYGNHFLKVHQRGNYVTAMVRESADLIEVLYGSCMWCGSLQPNISVDVDVHRLSIDSA